MKGRYNIKWKFLLEDGEEISSELILTIEELEGGAAVLLEDETEEDEEFLKVRYGNMYPNGTMFFKFSEPVLLFENQTEFGDRVIEFIYQSAEDGSMQGGPIVEGLWNCSHVYKTSF